MTIPVCLHCKTPLRGDLTHCQVCHMSLPLGSHGWVAVESPHDPDHRRPRQMIPCPACLVRIGRSEPEPEPVYERYAGRGRR